MIKKFIDISKHQTSYNAATAKAAGAQGIICRLAYAANEDAKVGTYAPATLTAGLPLGGYGFATWHYKSNCNMNLDTARRLMQQQVSAWISIAKKYGVNSWFAIDEEMEKGQEMGLSIGDNTTLLIEAANLIAAAGFTPCLYTGASFCKANVDLVRFTRPLWIAWYKFYGTKKDFDGTETWPLSGSWATWMNQYKDRMCMWQFSSEGFADKYGLVHGSNGLDKNWCYFEPGAAASSSADTGFDEYCFFPMDVLRVTQGVGYLVDGVPASSYSHSLRSVYDIAGADTGKSPVYAPFSCKVRRVYNGSTSSSKCNFTWFENTKRVKTADGKIHQPGMLFCQMVHCDDVNMTKYGVAVGAYFNQGEICYYEGVKGATGAHCHIGFSEGPWTGTGWHALSNGNWELNNPLLMHRICYLRPECQILDGYGYPWLRFGGATITPPSQSAAQPKGTYLPQYKGTSGSIVAALNAVKVDSSYAYREKIAAANNIGGYVGSAAQNIQMLSLLKAGSLLAPETAAIYFKKYSGTTGSIATALKAIGEDSSYTYRTKIAAKNNITNYTGTPAQNIKMLDFLKQGVLLKP